MIRRPPISTRTDTLFPYTTLFRSPCARGRADLRGLSLEPPPVAEGAGVRRLPGGDVRAAALLARLPDPAVTPGDRRGGVTHGGRAAARRPPARSHGACIADTLTQRRTTTNAPPQAESSPTPHPRAPPPR